MARETHEPKLSVPQSEHRKLDQVNKIGMNSDRIDIDIIDMVRSATADAMPLSSFARARSLVMEADEIVRVPPATMQGKQLQELPIWTRSRSIA